MQNKPNLYKKPNKLLIITKKDKISSKPNNSNDWKQEVGDILVSVMSDYSGDSESNYGDAKEKLIKLISSELQREREKVLEEVREIIESSYWISGTHFVVNGKQEKMVVKHELLSKINKLK